MSLDERTQAAVNAYADLFTSDWFLDEVENAALREGKLRYGQPGDWFRSIRWSRPAWSALHGADGPRGRLG
jgi:hypothetical protein